MRADAEAQVTRKLEQGELTNKAPGPTADQAAPGDESTCVVS